MSLLQAFKESMANPYAGTGAATEQNRERAAAIKEENTDTDSGSFLRAFQSVTQEGLSPPSQPSQPVSAPPAQPRPSAIPAAVKQQQTEAPGDYAAIDFAADAGKMAGSAALGGTAQAPAGVQAAAKGLVRDVATGEMIDRGGTPGMKTAKLALMSFLDVIGVRSLADQEKDRTKVSVAVEKAMSGVGIPGVEALAAYGDKVQKDIQSSISVEGKKRLATSNIKGNLFKGELSFGDDPSISGYALQLAGVLGSLAPVLLTGVVTKSGVAAGSVGGAMAAGEGLSNAQDYIGKLSHSQLLENSPYYAKLIDNGVTEAEAKKIVTDKAGESAALLQGMVGAVGGAVTGKLVAGAYDDILRRLGGRTIAGRTAVGLTGGALEEGVQEVGEGLASDFGIRRMIENKEIGEDSAANFILGAMGGGAVGSVRGAISQNPTPANALSDALDAGIRDTKFSESGMQRAALQALDPNRGTVNAVDNLVSPNRSAIDPGGLGAALGGGQQTSVIQPTAVQQSLATAQQRQTAVPGTSVDTGGVAQAQDMSLVNPTGQNVDQQNTTDSAVAASVGGGLSGALNDSESQLLNQIDQQSETVVEQPQTLKAALRGIESDMNLAPGETVNVTEVTGDKRLNALAKALYQAFGVTTHWVDFGAEGMTTSTGANLGGFNGYRHDKNTILVAPNADFMDTTWHELTHTLEVNHPDIYSALRDSILKNIDPQAKKNLYDTLNQRRQAEVGQSMSASELESELVAVTVGSQSKDPALLQQLFDGFTDKTLAAQFKDLLLEILNKISASLRGPQYIADRAKVIQARTAIVSAFSAYQARQSQTTAVAQQQTGAINGQSPVSGATTVAATSAPTNTGSYARPISVQRGKSQSDPIATGAEAFFDAQANPKKPSRIGRCHELTVMKVAMSSNEGLSQVLCVTKTNPTQRIWHSVAKDVKTGSYWEPIRDRWYTPEAMGVFGFEPVMEFSATESRRASSSAGVYADQTVYQPRGWQKDYLEQGDYDSNLSINQGAANATQNGQQQQGNQQQRQGADSSLPEPQQNRQQPASQPQGSAAASRSNSPEQGEKAKPVAEGRFARIAPPVSDPDGVIRVNGREYAERTEPYTKEGTKAYLKRAVDTLGRPKFLPLEPEKFFRYSFKTYIVNVSDIDSNKSDAENIQGNENAPKRFLAAYDGIVDPRDAIAIQDLGNGRFKVIDGNGTLTAFKSYGWTSIPANIFKSKAEFEAFEERQAAAPTYRAYILSNQNRRQLQAFFKPTHSRLVLDHITANETDAAKPTKVEVVGLQDAEGIQALVVVVDGRHIRDDGQPYHITLSANEGTKTSDAGPMLQRQGYNSITPFELKLPYGADYTAVNRQQDILDRLSDKEQNRPVATGEYIKYPLILKTVIATQNLLKMAINVKKDFDAFGLEVAKTNGITYKAGPIKQFPKSFQKIWYDYKKDATRIKDVVRATFVVDYQEDIPAAIQAVLAAYPGSTLKHNRYDPDPAVAKVKGAGYRDVMFELSFGGMLVELQMNTPEMMAAKEIGHKLYDDQVPLQQELEKPSTTQERAQTLQAAIDELDQQQRVLYGAAFKAVQARSAERAATILRNSASEISTPSSRAVVSVYNQGGSRPTPGKNSQQSALNPSGESVTGMSPETLRNSVPSGNVSGNATISDSPKTIPNGTINPQNGGQASRQIDSPFASVVSQEEADARISRRQKRLPGVGAPTNERKQFFMGGTRFVTGKITTQDWLDRVNDHMTLEDMQDARAWYQQLHETFAPIFGDKSTLFALSWLLSQKNASPTMGMMNVLRGEDVAKGKPVNKIAGLNHDAIVDVFSGRIPAGGIGAKLQDFVDSELGKQFRTLMKDNPLGRQPAAIDVWAQRDIGFLDSHTFEWVRKTFGGDAANQLQVNNFEYDPVLDQISNDKALSEIRKDKTVSGEAQYEYGIDFYNDVVDMLNAQNYDGGGWTAPQVQAVGWVNMQRVMGVKAEFVRDILDGNTRRVSIGLAPGEGSRFAITLGGKEISPTEAQKEISFLAEMSGVRIRQSLSGVGAYLTSVEGSIQVETLGSPESISDFMDMVGYAFQQTEIISSRPMLSGDRGAIDVVSPGLASSEDAIRFFQAYLASNPPVKRGKSGDLIAPGFQQIKVNGVPGIRLINNDGKFSEEQQTNLVLALNDAADKIGIELDNEQSGYLLVSVKSSKNDWVKDKDGKQFISSLVDRGRSEEARRLQRRYPPSRLDISGDQSIPASGSFSRPVGFVGPAEPAGRPNPRSREGAGSQGERGSVEGAIHYGRAPGLKFLSGSSFGSGIRGAEQSRLSQQGVDPRIKRRVYFYLPTQGGIPQPEAGLGGAIYSANLTGLYDYSSMPPIKGQGNALETAILDRGFTGYINREQGTVVVLDREVPVSFLGNSSDFAKTQRTIERIATRDLTRAEGSELVRRPGNTPFTPQLLNSVRAVAPSFRLENGEARVNASEADAVNSAMEEAGLEFRLETEPSRSPLGQFQRQLVQYASDGDPRAPALFGISRTAPVMKKIGAPEQLLVMTPGTVQKVTNPESVGKSTEDGFRKSPTRVGLLLPVKARIPLTVDEIMDVSRQIWNPVAIIKTESNASGTRRAGYMLVLDTPKEGNPVVAIVHDSVNFQGQLASEIASVYPVNEPGTLAEINSSLKGKLLLYLNKAKAIALNLKLQSKLNFKDARPGAAGPGDTKTTFERLPNSNFNAFARRFPPVPSRFTLPERTAREQFVENLFENRMSRVEDIQEAVVEQGGTLQVRDAQGNLLGTTDIATAQQRMRGAVRGRLDRFKKEVEIPLIQDAARLNVNLDEVAQFLYATYAPERNLIIQTRNSSQFPTDGGSGMTNAEAAQVLATFRASPNFANLSAISARFQAITRMTQQHLLSNGLVDQQTITQWQAENPNYVPLRGFELIDPDSGQGLGVGSPGRLDPRNPFVKVAKGRESKAGQILENVLKDYADAVVLAEKNQVYRLLLRFVRDNPDPALWQVNAPAIKRSYVRNQLQSPLGYASGEVRISFENNQNPAETIAVRVQGRPVFIQVSDTGMLDDMKMAGAIGSGDQARLYFRIWSGTMSTLAKLRTTLSPVFVAIDAIRNAETGGFWNLVKHGPRQAASVYAKTYKAARAAWEMERGNNWTGGMTPDITVRIPGQPVQQLSLQQLYNMFRDDGGKVGYLDIKEIEEIQKDIQTRFRAASVAGSLDPRTYGIQALNLVSKVEDLMLDAAGSIETSMRFASYMTRLQNGATRQEATDSAKQVTVNFDRRGKWTPHLGLLYMFANANIQGSKQTYNLIFKSGVAGAALGGSLMALGYAVAQIGSGDSGDDDQPYWDKHLYKQSKIKNLLFFKANGDTITIPMSYGTGFFVNLGYAMSDLQRGVPAAKVAAFLRDSFLTHFSPLGSAENLATFVSPTLLDPIIVNASNRTEQNIPLMPESPWEPSKPNSEKFWAATRGTMFQQLSAYLNKETGGTAGYSGKVDISPEAMRFWSGWLTGGAGGFVRDAGESIFLTSEIGNDAAFEKNKIPFIKAFFQNNTGKQNQMEFAKNSEEAERALTEWKLLFNSPQRREDGTAERLRDDKKLRELGGAVQAYKQALSGLRHEEIRIIDKKTAGDYDSAEAEERLKKLSEKKDRLYVRFNRSFYKADPNTPGN